MNKKLLIVGAFAIVAFIGLTAFGGETREQQEAEVAAAVTAKLDELRASMDSACTARAVEEANNRWALEQAGMPVKPGVGGSGSKGKGSGSSAKPGTSPTPSPTPLPEPEPPAPSNPKKDKMDQQNTDPSNTSSKKDKMDQQNTDPTNTNKKKSKMKSGGE